jgi:hypothetical protein
MMHCPEAAPPTVAFLGTVTGSGGALNSGLTLMYYNLQATVYDNSAKVQTSFPLYICFKNGNC